MNANSSTVSERIYTAIRNDILNKTLVSGEKLTIKSILYEEAQNGRLTDAARKIRIQSTIFSNQYESELLGNKLPSFLLHPPQLNAAKRGLNLMRCPQAL